MRCRSPRTPIPALAAAAAAAVWLGALPAAAIPADPPSCSGSACTVLFNGAGGFGISQADALFLADPNNLGLDIVTPSRVAQLGVDLDVFDIDFVDNRDVVPYPPSDTGPHVGTEHYQVQNVSGGDLIGQNYFLITQILDNFLYLGEQVDYRGTNIGMRLDPTVDPWVIVRVNTEAGAFFYPGVDLGSLTLDQIGSPFDVVLNVDGPLVEITTAGNVFRGLVLPELRRGSAFNVVPEPGAAALLGAGLLGLAASARRLGRRPH